MNFSKTQNYQLETFSPAQKATVLKIAKGAGVILVIAIAVDVLNSFFNGEKNFEIVKNLDKLILPLIIFFAIYSKKGSFSQNTNLTIQDGLIVFKENNRVKWKAPISSLSQIIQTEDPQSKKIKTFFVAADDNYTLPHTITKNQEFLNQIRMLNSKLNIQGYRGQQSPITSAVSAPMAQEGQDYVRIAVFVILILILLFYFLLK